MTSRSYNMEDVPILNDCVEYKRDKMVEKEGKKKEITP